MNSEISEFPYRIHIVTIYYCDYYSGDEIESKYSIRLKLISRILDGNCEYSIILVVRFDVSRVCYSQISIKKKIGEIIMVWGGGVWFVRESQYILDFFFFLLYFFI